MANRLWIASPPTTLRRARPARSASVRRRHSTGPQDYKTTRPQDHKTMKIELRNALAGMKGKVLALHALTAHKDNLAGLDKVFEEALKPQRSDAKTKLAKLIERARNKEPEASTEV